MMRYFIVSAAALTLAGCNTVSTQPVETGTASSRNVSSHSAQTRQTKSSLDVIAQDYVKLTLAMGEIENGYVDAYYGDEALAKSVKAKPLSLAEAGSMISMLTARLRLIANDGLDALSKRRKTFLLAQLQAAQTRHKMLSGKSVSFREESLGLFSATPDLKPLKHYDPILVRIDGLVAGEGDLASRVNAFRDQFTIPKNRLQIVFDTAIAECKKRTEKYITLPMGESFTMEFVTDKPWSGYNYYQGGYNSLIQINTDLPINISRAVDLGCHEGYPGHHAFNALLEKRLTREKGWQEFSIYPLFSPQSLIAEGSANYGINLAFPGEERLKYEREILYPMAGLDPAKAESFQRLNEAISLLSGARFTIAQSYLDGEISREDAIKATQKYQLVSRKRAEQSISFTDTYRSYVINYGLGQDMVRRYIEDGNPTRAQKWQRMEKILSEPTLPSDLLP